MLCRSFLCALTDRVALVADCGRINCQTVKKFERAKSLAKPSKTAINATHCYQTCIIVHLNTLVQLIVFALLYLMVSLLLY